MNKITSIKSLNLKLEDLIILILFPIILLVIQIWNISSFKLEIPFKFGYFWQLLTSAYVHQNTYHILGNLLYYFIFLIPLLLILYSFNKRARIQWLVIVFLVLPIINSLLHLVFSIFTKVNPSCGSSTIITGIIYFVIFYYLALIFSLLNNHKFKDNDRLQIVLLFLLGVGFILFASYYAINLVFMDNKFVLGHLVGIVGGITMGLIYIKMDLKDEIEWKSSNSEEDVYIKILNWAKDNPNFGINDICKKFPEYKELIINEIRIHDSLFCKNNNNPEKYMLSFEDRFRLLEYEELQEARQQSKVAMWIAIVSIILNIIAIVVQIFIV